MLSILPLGFPLAGLSLEDLPRLTWETLSMAGASGLRAAAATAAHLCVHAHVRAHTHTFGQMQSLGLRDTRGPLYRIGEKPPADPEQPSFCCFVYLSSKFPGSAIADPNLKQVWPHHLASDAVQLPQ